MVLLPKWELGDNAIGFSNRDRAEWPYFSNFYKSWILYDGVNWPTLEHAYQAAKTLDIEQKKQIEIASTPGKAKRLGTEVTLRPDWKDIKIKIMAELVNIKFNDRALRYKLKKTGDKILIEDTQWGDTFWGVNKSLSGYNWLGKILMAKRKLIS